MGLQDIPIIVTSVIGFISLCRTLVPFIGWVWATFLRPPKNLKHYGSWALITGSTDGIGKALAFELASKGLNLVLVGRNPTKLEDTCNGIREKYGGKVDVKSIVSDFAYDNGEEIVKKIKEGTHGLDVGVLINNAGVGDPRAKYFHEVECETIDNLMKVNIEGATWVSKAVLPVMMKKKKGAIVNVGSGAGSYSVLPSAPLCTVYASTKAYIEMFSKSLSVEYKKQGIDIQCQVPLLVMTKMTTHRRSSFLTATPKIFSAASVRWIGYEHICVPYWIHAVESRILRILPDALLNNLILRVYLVVRQRVTLKESMKQNMKP